MKFNKGTFIIIPNKNILCGKSSELQSIFFWLCEHSNDKGESFPSRKTLAKESGVSIRTLDKYIDEMVELKLITKTLRKKENSKENTSNLYQILLVEIPEVVSILTQGSVENDTTPSVKKDTVTVSSINSISSTKIQAELEEKKEFNLEDEIKRLLGYQQYWLNIIGLYIKVKKVNLTNKKQVGVLVSRFTKTAKILEAFDRKQIEDGMRKCMQQKDFKNNSIDWTLETLLKQLTK
jgi:DNA-binding transcriptional regulator YhcF (GntR family)